MVAQAKGSSSSLIMEWESSFWVPRDAADRVPIILPFNSTTLKGTRSLGESQTIRGDRNPTEPFEDRKDVSGNIVVPVDDVVFGYILSAFFGLPTTTGSGPYTHVFKIDPTAALPSFVIEQGFLDLATPYYILHKGCKLNTLEITVGTQGELLATLGIMGADDEHGTSSYDSAVGATAAASVFGNRFQMRHASVKEGGSPSNLLSEFSVSMNNNLDGDSFVIGGGGVRDDLPEGIAQIGGTITALFKNSAILAKAKAGTKTSLQLALTNGTKSVTFDFNEVRLEDTAPEVSGPAGVRIPFNFRAFYNNDAAESAVVVTLVNSVASYAME